jgi:hypothetical protein
MPENRPSFTTETWERNGNNGVHLRTSKYFAQCVAITEGDNRRERAQAIAMLPELFRALEWYVNNDQHFAYLDRGIGTTSEAGIARLNARDVLKKACECS